MNSPNSARSAATQQATCHAWNGGRPKRRALCSTRSGADDTSKNASRRAEWRHRSRVHDRSSDVGSPCRSRAADGAASGRGVGKAPRSDRFACHTLGARPAPRGRPSVASRFWRTLGAAYGAALARDRATLAKTAAFGVGTWAFGSFVLLPVLKIMRPEWRASAREVSVNLAAHLIFAASVALLTEELEKQASWEPLGYPLSFVAHTG